MYPALQDTIKRDVSEKRQTISRLLSLQDEVGNQVRYRAGGNRGGDEVQIRTTKMIAEYGILN